MKSLDEIVMSAIEDGQNLTEDIEVKVILKGNIASRYVFLNKILADSLGKSSEEIDFYLFNSGVNYELLKIQNVMSIVSEN